MEESYEWSTILLLEDLIRRPTGGKGAGEQEIRIEVNLGTTGHEWKGKEKRQPREKKKKKEKDRRTILMFKSIKTGGKSLAQSG